MRRRGIVGLLAEVLVLSVVAGTGTFVLLQSRLSTAGEDGPVTVRSAAAPTSVSMTDSQGRAVALAHAAVVRAVHGAVIAGDLELLRSLYVGEDWAEQRALLARPQVRAQLRAVLETHPANLGEGYVYPGFASFGWVSELDVADARQLGTGPGQLPDPVNGYRGLETAFFLEPTAGGALQWRGIRYRGST